MNIYTPDTPDPVSRQVALRHFVDSKEIIVWTSDLNDVVLYINQFGSPHARHLKGLTLTEWAQHIHPDDYERVIRIFRNAKANQAGYRVEHRLVRSDGSVRWIISSTVPRFTEDGKFSGFDGINVDVTEEHHAAEYLAKSEAEYRLLAESSVDLISHHDADTRYRYVSPSYAQILGYDASELIGNSAYDLIHPDDRDLLHEEGRLQITTGSSGSLIEIRKRHKQGHYLWMGMKARVLVDPATGRKIGSVAVSREITKERQDKEELKKREEQFRGLTKLASDWYWETDENDRFSFISDGVEWLLGVNPAKMLGKTRLDLATDPNYPSLLECHEKMAQRLPFKNIRYSTKVYAGGPARWLSISGEPMYQNGVFRGYRGIGCDITEEVSVAERLARLADENRALIENSLDIMVMVDQDGRFLRVNAAVKDILGYEPQELLGKRYTEFLVPDDLERATAIDEALRTGRTTAHDVESRWVRKDGSVVYLSSSIRWSNDSNVMYATVRDVTERHSIQAELQKSKDELISVLESIGDAFFAVDRHWNITYVNQKTARFVGRRKKNLLGKVLWEAVPEMLSSQALPYYRTAMATGQKTFFELYHEPLRAWLDVRAYPHEQGLSVFFHNVTAQHEAEAAIRAGETRLRKIMEMTPAGYMLTDGGGVIVEVNPAMRAISGYPEDELIGRDFMELLSGCSLCDALYVKGGATNFHGMEAVLARRGGSSGYILVNGNIERNSDGNAVSLTAFITDITERKNSESRMELLATHDSLTGLPNRALVNSRLQQKLYAARKDESIAVLFIDLDRFKEVNDSMGHAQGDVLLCEVSTRLQQVMRPDDIVARLGGDEFIAAAHCSKGSESAASIAEKLLSALTAPFNIGDQEVFIGASIGISMFPQDGQTNEQLLQCADTAMYQVKAAGRNGYRFFEAEMGVAVKAKMTIEQSLRRALERNEFELHYQPRIDLKTMALTGMEALIRWNHPQLGRVPPLQFIPIAEERGFIEAIGHWALEKACAQTRHWIDKFGKPLHVSVNLSARQLKSDDFTRHVQDALDKAHLPSHCLELELTESALIDDVDVSTNMLKKLRALGVRLSVDDFGTGYSALSYLRRFPLNILKLDRSFLNKESDGVGSFEFIKAFIDMAHALNLSVVAEGVEDEETAQFLRDSACDEAQGYLFAKPLSVAEFEEYLSRRSVHFGK